LRGHFIALTSVTSPASPTLEPRPRVLLLWALAATCLVLFLFSAIEQPGQISENLRWVRDQFGDVAEDNLFLAVFAPLIVLFGVVVLRQMRAGKSVPWKDVAVTALVGPATLLVGTLIAGDGSSPLGLVVFLVPVAQVAWSAVRVTQQPDMRGPLIAGFLLTIWVTLGIMGVAIGLYTGFGRTWL